MELGGVNVLTFSIAISGFLAFQFAFAGLLTYSRRRSVVPIILYFNLGWFQFHSLGVISGGIINYPHFLLTNLPLTALFGPLLYHFVSQFWMEKNTKIRWFEGIPFLIVLIVLTPIYILSAEEKRVFIASIGEKTSPTLQLLILGINLWTFFYLFRTFQALNSILDLSMIKKDSKIQFLFLLLILTTIACLSGLTQFWLNPVSTISILSTTLLFIIFVLFVLREKYPMFFNQVQTILLTEKKKRSSQLLNLDLDALEKRLKHSLYHEKLYKQEGLTLAIWANHLGISQHQLSEFLNTHLKTGFFQILNQVRISEAKELCLKEPKKSILHIAFEVGFPSKSTFYEAFRKETGQTPQEFKKTLKKNPA